MEMFNDTPQDITKTGAVGLKGLPSVDKQQSLEDFTDEQLLERLKLGANAHRPRMYGKTYEDYEYDETQPDSYGSSKYDQGFITQHQLENLEDTRARKQSDFTKIFNGTVKGVTTFGTTFLDGTAGLLVGLGTGVYNMFDDDENTSFTSGIWNNWFNQKMNQANEFMEKVLPNYYTNDEREHPMQHLFNANFIGDKFIKNLGFTVGALGSAVAFGGAYGSIGKLAGKAALGLGTAPKAAVGVSKAITMGSGAVAAAVAEGSIEALQTANQMEKENLKLYEQQRDQNKRAIQRDPNLSEYEKELLLEDEDNKFNQAKLKLTEDKAKAGNLDFLLNIPILTLSNIVQFNKLLSNGFRSGKRIANVVGRETLKPGGLLTRTAVGRGAKALAKSGLTEGKEEVLQQVASDVSNTIYSLDLNDYYKSTIDSDANAQATDYIKAAGQQILATLGREDTWEQFIIGSLTGVLGMPVFGKANTERKADIGKGNSVGISGGFFGQLNEINEQHERDQKVADYINQRMADPKFKEKYQGLVRHIYFQDKMDKALDANLEKEYKDSEFAMLYNDVMMFMSAGKKDVLVDMIKDSMQDLSDEQVANIIKDTTRKETNKEGNEVIVGPFIKADGNQMSNDEVRDKIRQNGDTVLKAIEKIEDTFDQLDYTTNGQLSNEQVQQLAYMQMQVDNWRERTSSVGEEAKEFFDGIKKNLEQRLENNRKILEADPGNVLAQNNIKALEENIKSVEMMTTSLETHAIREAVGIEDHSKARKAYRHMMKAVESKYIKGLSTPSELAVMKQRLLDLESMSYSMEMFDKKFKDYIEHPDKITTDNEEVLKALRESDLIERANDAATDLEGAEDVNSFESKMKDSGEDEAYARALDTLVESGNPIAKQYKINNQVAQEQNSELDGLVEKKIEIPTIDNKGTLVVDEDLANRVKRVIAFRRRYSNPFVSKDGAVASYDDISNPYLDEFDEVVDGSTGWLSVFGIDDPIEIQRIKDVFSHVTKTINESRLRSGALSDRTLYGYPEKTTVTIITGADGTTTVAPTEPKSGTTNDIVINVVDYMVDIPYETSAWNEDKKSIERSQGVAKIVDIAGRKVIVLNVGGFNVPFYLSTGSGGKKNVPAGKWYPFFGISETDGWFNKLTENDINNFYGIPELKQISEKLNEVFGDIRDDDSIPKVGRIESSLEVINKDLSPTMNGLTSTTDAVKANVASVKAAFDNLKKKKQFRETNEPSGIVETTQDDYKEQAEEANKKAEEEARKKNAEEHSPKQKDYWKNNIPHYGVKERAEGLISPPLAPDKKSPLILHGVLKGLGAYEYVNSGKLQKGDKVKFVIQPSLLGNTPASVTDPELKTQLERTIFIIKESDGQVIGVLPDSDDIIAGYEGLMEFIDFMRDGFEKNRTGFDPNITTEIEKIIPGWVPYIQEEVSLKESTKNIIPEFESEEFTDKNTGDHRQRLRLKIKSSVSDDVFKPVVRIAHFTSGLLESDIFKGSSFYKHMHNAIEDKVREILDNHRDPKNVSAISNAEVNELRDVIKEFLYTYTGKPKHLHVSSNKGAIIFRVEDKSVFSDLFKTTPPSTRINRATESQTTVKERLSKVYSASEIADDIMSKLASLDLPIQVDFSRVEDRAYMQERIDAGLLFTNVQEATLYDNWYTLKPVSKKDGNWTSKTTQESVKGSNAVGEAVSAAVGTAESPKPAETPKPEVPSRPQTPGKTPPRRGMKFRLATKKEWKKYNKEQEIQWLDKALPQLSAEERVRFTRGLIDVADLGKKAWGMFDRGIIVLSDVAAEGTVYHEAFHTVFNMLLSPSERQALFREARKLWPRTDGEIELEEKMAEEFRRYVMHRMENSKPQSLRARIANFFSSLWEKIKNWRSELMYNYFAKINEGTYAGKPLQDTDVVRYRDYDLEDEDERIAYNRLMEIWNDRSGRPAYYEDENGNKIPVPVFRRTRHGIEFRFDTEKEAQAFKDFWRKETGATFSDDYYIPQVKKHRVYMQKPGVLSEQERQELREDMEYDKLMHESPFDKLADAEKSELLARGYTKEDYDSLNDMEQEAIRECFFVL